jgi:UPF0042 nucleotide-binding protein
MRIEFISFGYKYGELPPGVNFVFDVRCLHNPHKNPHLRRLTGLDQAVQDDVFARQHGKVVLKTIVTALFNMLAGEKRDIRVAIGCFGGRHRSVAMTQEVSRIIRETFVPEPEQVLIRHRELDR